MDLKNMDISESEDDGFDWDMEDIEPSQCIMTVEEFINSCKAGHFNDDDGYGELLDKDNNKTNFIYAPSEYKDMPEGHTHIIWYPK